MESSFVVMVVATMILFFSAESGVYQYLYDYFLIGLILIARV